MNKILLVIRREFVTRVRKPSFWILTILVPVLLAALYAVPIYLSMRPIEKSVVLVVDESGIFGGMQRDNSVKTNCSFASTENIEYRYAATVDYAMREMGKDDDISSILYIRRRASDAIPTDACLYYKTDLPPQHVRFDVDKQLQRILRNQLLKAHGITDEEYALISNTKINLHTEDLETGREAFLEVKSGLGLILSVLIFFVIFMFGAQVMRGVVEEKSNRIIEVIVCSVKPFQLMMGKVIGIAMVGLAQFLLWFALTGVGVAVVQHNKSDVFEQARRKHNVTEVATKGSEATQQMEQAAEMATVSEVVEGISSINFKVIVPVFLFFFVFGYLLYATLFAAAGAMCDTDTDTQLFSLPLTIPLLLTLLLMPVIIDSPSGTLSQVLSLIPFTSPVAMMLRVPFGLPPDQQYQLYLSAALLVITIPLCSWIAARIYRNSILRYGRLRFLRRKNNSKLADN